MAHTRGLQPKGKEINDKALLHFMQATIPVDRENQNNKNNPGRPTGGHRTSHRSLTGGHCDGHDTFRGAPPVATTKWIITRKTTGIKSRIIENHWNKN